MNGAPEDWSILREAHEGDLKKVDLSISQFFLKSFRNELKQIWYQPFVDDELNFKPLAEKTR